MTFSDEKMTFSALKVILLHINIRINIQVDKSRLCVTSQPQDSTTLLPICTFALPVTTLYVIRARKSSCSLPLPYLPAPRTLKNTLMIHDTFKPCQSQPGFRKKVGKCFGMSGVIRIFAEHNLMKLLER